MKLRCVSVLLGVVLAACVLPNAAFAKSEKLIYEGQIGGKYYFSINGSSSFTALMCDSFDNRIHKGESWTAQVSPFLQGIANSMFGPSMTIDYKAAGLIYKSMLAGALTTLQAQWAVWGLFSTNAQKNPLFSTYGGAATDKTYLALAQTAPNSAYNGLLLYTPKNAKPGSGPQEFIGFNQNAAVPEPGSLTLFGTGLVLLAFLTRKFAKS